jgi:type II secretory pathway component PulF
MADNSSLRAALQSQLGTDPAPAAPMPARKMWARRASREDIASFYRQFALVIESGFPLAKSLSVVAGTVQNAELARTCAALAASLESGRALDASMKEFPWYFPASHIAVVRASHESGSLGEALDYLAESTEHQEEIRGRIEGALAYPITLLAMGIAALAIIFYFVVPSFQASIAEANLGERSGIAALVIAFSGFLRTWYGLPLILGAVAGVVLGLRGWRAQNRAASDRLLGRLPVIGRMLLLAHTSQFVDVLHMLLRHGVQLAPALPLAAEGVNNAYLRQAIVEAVKEVAAGRSMVQPLRSFPNLPPVFLEMLALGEASGRLPDTLGHLSRFLRRRLTATVDRFGVMIQPILLVVGGVVVTGVVLAFFTTYFDVLMDLANIDRETVGAGGR